MQLRKRAAMAAAAAALAGNYDYRLQRLSGYRSSSYDGGR